jgi:chromosome segregation ATPase
MQSWVILFRVIFLIIGIILLSLDALLYNSFEKQKIELDSMKDKQDVEAEFNSNKFKYQEEQIERISQDLENAQQQIKDQKDALMQEIEKRQQTDTESKGVQTSLVDIKAETDAIKQDMKGWQKDYVSILAQLEKKMDDSQEDIKKVTESLDSLKADIEEKIPASGGMTNETVNDSR